MPVHELSREPLGGNHGVDKNPASGFCSLDLANVYKPEAPAGAVNQSVNFRSRDDFTFA